MTHTGFREKNEIEVVFNSKYIISYREKIVLKLILMKAKEC